MSRPSDAPAWMSDKDFEIDLGAEHWARFMGHGGEGITKNGQPVPYTERYGLSVLHRCAKTESGWDGLSVLHRCAKTESGWDEGLLTFNVPGAADDPAPKWTVESWDPLTLSPSVLQPGCGDHGFIRQGRWERA